MNANSIEIHADMEVMLDAQVRVLTTEAALLYLRAIVLDPELLHYVRHSVEERAADVQPYAQQTSRKPEVLDPF